ncbi:MAG: spermine/spermidine synthase domain-containing protein, partial [Planctomycetota bacterium]
MEVPARRMRFLLILSTLVLGACGLAYEYTLSVLGNHLLGSSYEEIFIVIGLMMFAMGLGAGFQRYVRTDLFEKFILLEAVLGLVGGFSAMVIYLAFIHTESHRVILYAFALVIGLLIGLEIPLIIRINQAYNLKLRNNLSEILSMDYVGALLGALAFTYVLLTRFTLNRISFLLGLINVGVALAGLVLFHKLVPRRAWVGGLCMAGAAGLVLGFLRAEDWARHTEQQYYRDPIVASLTTPYQHIVLTQRKNRLQMYINGHLQFSSRDEHIYHEMLVHPAMLMSRRQKRVLILGGGDGLAVR